MSHKLSLKLCSHCWGRPFVTTSEEHMRAFSIKRLNQVRPSSLAPLAVFRKDQASGQRRARIKTANSKFIAKGDLDYKEDQLKKKHHETLVHIQLDPKGWPLSWDSITDEPLPTLDSSLACSPDPLHVSLAFGVSLILTSVCLGEVHLNPVVTLALVAGLRVSPWRAVLLVGAQLLGALSACALLLDITPTALKSNLGVNEMWLMRVGATLDLLISSLHQCSHTLFLERKWGNSKMGMDGWREIESKRERREDNIVCQVAPGVYLYQALLVEMAVTFQLVLCVQAATHPKSAFSSVAPVVIGLSVTLGHLVAIGFTGCGMNPARSFGPAVLTMNFHNHWVYWVGPCAGSLLAWVLHDLVLHPRWSCLGDWVTECKETLLKDLSKQSRGPENHIEA
uniref:Uncharacterized protein n=1 Tax=Cyprinus carpio TaxID=7962 RepID=A0A8C2CG31_CYPCA